MHQPAELSEKGLSGAHAGRQAVLPDMEVVSESDAKKRPLRAIDFGYLLPLAKTEARKQGIPFTYFVKRAVAAALGNPPAPEQIPVSLSRDEKVQFEVDQATFDFVQRAATAEQLSISAWGATLLRRLTRSHRGLYPSEIESLERARTEFADARRELVRALGAGVDRETQAAMKPFLSRVDGYYNQVAGILRMIDLERLERLHGKTNSRR